MDRSPNAVHSDMDRRVDRSRRKLHEALVALILEQGWDRVSVQAVCARAGVGRSTFYVHFADKEDLLIGGLDHVRADLRRMRQASRDRRPFGFVRGLIEHADESRRLFRAVIGRSSAALVQQKFREVVLDLMLEDLRDQRVAAANLPTMSRFLSGALVELLTAWVDAERTGSAADVEREFVRLAMRVLPHPDPRK